MFDQQDKQFIQESIETALKGTEVRIGGVETQLGQLVVDVKSIDARVGGVETALKGMESRIIGAVGTMVEENILPQFDEIRKVMVTKDYLDDKLTNLRGDLVVMMRKEDTKLRELVNVLREKNVLTDPDVQRIIALEPFSKLSY